MSKAIHWAMFTAILAATLLAAGCGTHAESAATNATGSLQLSLRTTAGGGTYRLNNVYVTISPNQPPYFYQTLVENNPSEDQLSTSLATGSYSVYLQQWTLQRADSVGVYHDVVATLESGYSQNVTIYNGTTTTITFSFQTDGIIVTVGSGKLNLAVHVDVADAACTPLGNDCPVGSWCPPASLSGADLHCVPAGGTGVGQACQSPTDCVANASCFASGGGGFCRALCPSSQFNLLCDSGGSCLQVTSEYGYCTGGDAGVEVPDGGSDGDGSEVVSGPTMTFFNQQGPQCGQCAQDMGCFDPTFAGGVCENPPLTAHGSMDGSRTYQEMCFQTLTDIFGSHCALGLQLVPCLCGNVDPASCLNGSAQPNGPVYPDYVADFGSSIGSIANDFESPDFGAGMANGLVQCVQAFSCPCNY